MARWGAGVSVGPLWWSKTFHRKRAIRIPSVTMLAFYAMLWMFLPPWVVVIITVVAFAMIYVITEPGRRIKRWLQL